MTPAFLSAILTKVGGEISAMYPAVPIRMPNAPIPDTEHMYFSIHVVMSDEVFQMCLGKKSGSRSVGFLQVDVFTPKDKGVGEGHNAAYAVSKKLKRYSAVVGSEGKLTMKDAVVQDRGEVRGKQKHQVNVPVKYDFNDV